MKNLSALCSLVLMATTTFAQQRVSDGTVNAAINPNAIVEMQSNNKGLLQPRVALTMTTNAAPLAAHVAGMHVYNKATAGDVTPGEYYNDGTKWVRLSTVEKINTYAFGSGAPTGSCTANTLYTDTLSTSATSGQQWTCSGGSWVSYTGPNATEWYLNGTNTDAGGDKTSKIVRSGNVYVGNNQNGTVIGLTNHTDSPTSWPEIYMMDRVNNLGYSIQAGTGYQNRKGFDIMEFPTGGPRLTILCTSGNVGISQVAPAYKLDVNGDIRSATGQFRSGTRSGNYMLVLQSDRNMVLYDNGSAVWTSGTGVSDIHTKTDIKNAPSMLARLNKMRIVDFKYKTELDDKNRQRVGVIAQDVQKLFPEYEADLIYLDEKADRYLVHYDKLSVLLIKSVQEQQVQLEAQQTQLEAMKQRLEALEAKK